MLKNLQAVFATLASVFFASPAQAANWIYEGSDSAFDGGGTHLVIGGDGLYAFGIRCDKDGPVFLLVTPETFSNEDVKGVGFTMTKMLLKVDEGETIEHFATVDSANGKLRSTASAVKSEIELIRDAKNRLAVAMKIGDLVIHEAQIPARGSTAAVSKFLKNCKTIESETE